MRHSSISKQQHLTNVTEYTVHGGTVCVFCDCQDVTLLQVLVEQLRQQCLEEKVDKRAEAVKAYSALTQSPKEWTQEVCLHF